MSQEPNKFFIITSGPTGSGKTGLIKATLKQIFPDKTEQEIDQLVIKKLLFDDLVENSRVYKDRVIDIIEEVKEKCCKEQKCEGEELENCEKEKYTNESETIGEFNEIYMKLKIGESGCEQSGYDSVPITQEQLDKLKLKEKNNCYNLFNILLEDSLVQKPDIIVFEITGNDITTFKWVLDMVPEEYTVIVSYSLVQFDKLLERNSDRAYKDVQTFFNNRDKHAPRVPEIRKTEFLILFEKIRRIASELYRDCFLSHNTDICGKKKVNRMLLFDNNEDVIKGEDPPPPKNIFDSNKVSKKDFDKKDFDKILNTALGIVEPIKTNIFNLKASSKTAGKKTRKVPIKSSSKTSRKRTGKQVKKK